MNRKIIAIIAIILYIVAVIGILFLVQTPAIVLLTMLPIGLFLVSHEAKFAEVYGPKFIYLGYFILGVFFIGILVLLGYSLITGGSYYAPLFTTILAIALFFSNQALKSQAT